MDKLTPEEQKKLNEALQENVESVEDLKNALVEAGDASGEIYNKIADGLEKNLGKQIEMATEAEKLFEIARASYDIEVKRLDAQEALMSNQQKIASRAEQIKDIEQQIQDIKDQELEVIERNQEGAEEALKTLEAQRKSLEGQKMAAETTLGILEEQRNNMLINLDVQDDNLQKAKQRLRAAEALAAAQAGQVRNESKANDAATNREDIIQNQLEQMFGIKDTSGSITDALVDAFEETGSLSSAFSKTFESATVAMGKLFTRANVLKLVLNKLSEGAERFKKEALGADSGLTKLVETSKEFTKATGALESYGEELRQIYVDHSDGFNVFDQAILSNKELGDSYLTLYEQFNTFTDFGPKARADLTETAGLLGRLGVSASTTAGLFNKLSKNFNSTPAQLKKITNETQKFARALGVGPNKMLKDMEENFNLLAEYGQEKGTQVFKELAVAAKKTGIEMKELVGIAETFDTFEGAATAANSLNVALGGPFLNSMQMHNATISERIQLIQDSMAASGKSFDEMGRMQKKLIADQIAGGDVAKAQALLNKNNVDNIKATTDAYSDQAAALDDLDDAAKKTQTLADQEIKIAEAKTAAYNALGDVLVGFQKVMNVVKMFLQPFIAAFDFLGATLKGVVTVVSTLFAAFKLAPIIFGALKVALGPVGLAFAGIAYVISLIITHWNKIKSFFGFGGTEDKEKEGRMSRLYKEEPGASPISGLRYGTDSVSQAGVYKVGEAGMEYVSLAQGDTVINNENIQKLKQASMSPAATAAASGPTSEITREVANQVAPAAGQDQQISIVLKLDSDVLARHAVRVSKETINEVFELS